MAIQTSKNKAKKQNINIDDQVLDFIYLGCKINKTVINLMNLRKEITSQLTARECKLNAIFKSLEWHEVQYRWELAIPLYHN